MAEWKVLVVFSGLILFARDPETNRITHALLADGRAEHHHHGSVYPTDPSNCTQLVRQDFDHEGLIFWRPSGTSGRLPGGETLAKRYRITFEWECDGSCVFPDPPDDCESVASGACPLPPENLKDQPDMDGNYSVLRSFFWLPDLGAMAGGRPIAEDCLEPDPETGVTPSVVLAQVPLVHGSIGTGDFAWAVGTKGRYWIPEMLFTGEEATGAGNRRNSASELVAWRPAVPTNAQILKLFLAELDPRLGDPRLLAEFEVHDTPLQIHISNSPERRCQGQPHPGRLEGSPVHHVEMLYDMLYPHPPPISGSGIAIDHLAPAEKQIPWVPHRFRSHWAWLWWRNVVPYVPMSSVATNYQASEALQMASFDDLAPAAGTVERPICIPAYADSE